jgi:hypothetical protein
MFTQRYTKKFTKDTSLTYGGFFYDALSFGGVQISRIKANWKF